MSWIDGEHYEEGRTDGWVVEAVREYERGDRRVRSVTYWYGPRSGWGTTSGGLDYSARVWARRRDAEAALRKVYGGPAAWKARGYRPRRLADVLEERAA